MTARLASSEVSGQSRGDQRLEGWLGSANSVSLLVIASLLLGETLQYLDQLAASGQGLIILVVASLGVGINSLTIYLLHHDRHYNLSVRPFPASEHRCCQCYQCAVICRCHRSLALVMGRGVHHFVCCFANFLECFFPSSSQS